MTLDNSSGHFVPLTDIPEIASSTSFFEVYERLSSGGYGGFILMEQRRAKSYVKAYELALVVVSEAGGDVQKLKKLANTPIGELVTQAIERAAVVPLHDGTIDVGADPGPLQDRDDMVYDVTEGGKSIGWFLNHEHVAATTTRKTVFYCERGHPNPDPDHGTCYSCPGAIVKADD